MSAFSVFTDRKKRKKNTETPTVEQYYELRARRLSHVRYTCLLLTVLFIVYGFAVHGEELTSENFRYMLKFLDLTDAETEEAPTDVRFDYAEGNIGGIYKGDLAVLNTDGLTVYSREAGTAGDRLFQETFRMEDPQLAVTEQNIFAYDLGGNEVRMFNSYSQIARLSMDYPIYGFSASDSGNFAVITSEKNYRTAVYVYDSYARQIYKRLLSDTYIDQVSLSPDGSRFIALGHESGGGYLRTVLQVYSVKDEEPVFKTSYTGELPLMAGYLSDRSYAVLTGSSLRVYEDGAEQPAGELPLGGKNLHGCVFSGGKVLLTFGESGLSGGTVLTVYDERANAVSETHCDGAIEDLHLKDGTLYVLTMGSVTVTSLSGSEKDVYTVGKDALQVLFDTDNSPIVFEKSTAYRLQTQ